MKLTVSVRHYGPTHTDGLKFDGQSKIWVIVEDPQDSDDYMVGCGYIDNPFPENYFGESDKEFDKKVLPGTLVKTVFMEGSNGGRTNNKVYNSIPEYLADPVVKAAVREKCLGGFSLRSGDPDSVDMISTFVLDEFPEKEFTVSDRNWGKIIPDEWYREFYEPIIERLDKADVWETAADAQHNTEVCDDLFGDRAFPVIRAPISLRSEIEDLAEGCFKSCSNTLVGSEYIYIGLRSKVYEIANFPEIYEKGGFILKYESWDW